MLFRPAQPARGYALLTVLVFTGLAVFVLTGVLQWSSQNARLTQRNNEFNSGTAAGDAAVEKVVGRIAQDFLQNGQDYVDQRLERYRLLVPERSEREIWASYRFTDLEGTPGRVSVDRITSWAYGNLQTKYAGLRAYFATYRVASTATDLASPLQVPVSAQQEIQIASIPIFGFGIFYFPDLEICPDTSLTVVGRVHCNANIYVNPRSTLVLRDHVTAAGKVIHDESPDDPVDRQLGRIDYRGEHDGGVNSLNLPVGTNNTPDVLRSLVEIPPVSESINSVLGRQRYFNKADLIIRVYDDRVAATSGASNDFGVNITWLQARGVVNTNISFFDKRENKMVVATEIDIVRLNQRYADLINDLGRAPKTIYVADLRTQAADTLLSVRLINGQTLPQQGLTVATPNPLYVKGHYNAYQSHLGTTNTTRTVPASLIADAITILSGSWNDADSGSDLSSRRASATTVNAAVMAGIVPSGSGYYSGGMENFFRLLEDWSSRKFTFNGSIVGLCDSRWATAPWGATWDVYNPPNRAWSFDLNFRDATKLPPGTPELRAVIRGKWATSVSQASS